MERKLIWRVVLVGALATWLAGCPGPKDDPGHDPGTTHDAGTDTDAGTEPDGGMQPLAGPEVTTQDSFGAFVPSPTDAILVGSHMVLYGTKNSAADPAWFGRPSVEDSMEGWMRSGLIVQNTETGAARVYTEADGLPLAHLSDVFNDYGNVTAPIFDLDWISKDSIFVAAGWDFVTRGTIAEDGSITFQSTRVKAVGQSDWAKVAHVVFAGNELFVATDQGVAVVDPTTLGTKRWLDFGSAVTGTVWTNAISVGNVDGQQMVGLVFGPEGQPSSHVGVIKPGDTTVTVFEFTDGSKPVSVYGMNGMMLVGAVTSDSRGQIYAIGQSPDGLAMDVMVPADSMVNTKGKTLVPGAMAWDDQRGVLVVGGKLIADLTGDGLMQFQGSSDGTIWGSAEPVVMADDPYDQVLPLQVDEMAFDAQGRLYLAGKQQCSEVKLRQLPVWRLERDELNNVKLVRPYVSGVRDIEVDPEGNTWLALRDADTGLQCEGLAVANTTCRLRKDGACEMVPIVVNDGDSDIRSAPGAIDLAFGRADKKEMAMATRGDATWLRINDNARAIMTQIDPDVSLRMTAAAFSPGSSTLWVGSKMQWDEIPGFDNEVVNKRGPHGLGLLEYDETGIPTFTRRYVRAKSDDPNKSEIEGMPSDTVWAILPLEGNRRALVSMGKDRWTLNVDHQLGDVAPVDSSGGVVLVDDETVTPFAAPEGQSFGEVTALTEGSDGSFFAVDDQLGVLKLDLEAKTVSVWAAPAWASGERPLSLAVDGTGRIAVGTTQGLFLFGADTGVTHAFADQAWGFVWKVKFMADGALYAGTDNGLVRLGLDGAELPVHAEADAMLQPGELRLETAGGAIEDGPGLPLERLRAALDRIAAAR